MSGSNAVLVVIVNYRAGPIVVDCLASIASQVQALRGGRVIVVDNDSGDASANFIADAINEKGWSPLARSRGPARGHDGVNAVALMATRVLPSALRAVGSTTIEFHGSWRDDCSHELRCTLAAVDRSDQLVIDLHALVEVGAEPIALLLIAQRWFGPRAGFAVAGASPRTVRAFRRLLADDLLHDARRPQAHG
jgi:glycosyltransferase involved in cell wall biosynthesis